MELCGGTHVSNNTAEIPRWKMISDQGIAAGVQCIQALAQRTVIEEVCAAQNESSSLRIELLSPTEETKPNTQHTRFIEDSQFGSHGFDTLLCYPGSVSTDGEQERVFISDTLHNRVIITDRDGTVIDCIGSVAGFEDGPFETSQLHSPVSTSFHAETNCLFIADCENHAIRKADLSNRVLQTVYPLPAVPTRASTIQSLLHWLGFTKSEPHEEGKEEGKKLILSFPWHLVMVSSTQFIIASYGFKNLWTIDVESGATSEDTNQEPHEITQTFLAFKSQAESVRGGNWDHACEKLESMGFTNLVSQASTLKDCVIFSDPEKEQVLKMDLRTGSISSLEFSNLGLLGLPSWWSLPVNLQFSSSPSSTGQSHQVFFQNDVQELCECFKVQPGTCLISVDVSIPRGTSLVEPVSEGSVWRQGRGCLVELSVLGGDLAARKTTAAQQYVDDLIYLSHGDDESSEESLPIPKPSAASGLPLFSLVDATRGTGEVVFDAVLYLKHTGPPKGSSSSSSDQSLPTMPGTTTGAERPSSSTPAAATDFSNAELLLPPPLRRPPSLFKNAKQLHDFPEGTVLLKHLHIRVRLEVSDEAPEDDNNNMVQIHIQL
ncbi:hypothetical protein BDL97_15G071600 [Sphagnum fallax]|nr:hypothetical protein BDL97_15G071600 [Sphagnum fallax]KAH8940103.1 hypothetical protein BDL97_15G071600 [Sphagnum fallax]